MMKEPLFCKEELLSLVAQYAEKFELSKTVGPDYYDPGMMENLDQYKGIYDEQAKLITVCCESKGLRYDNRTSNLETVSVGDAVQIVRDHSNSFNSNNFSINSETGASLGYLPAELCNALAPLYDVGCVEVISAVISYIEKIGQRSRYAKQGILFVELVIKLRGI